ncbi:MAG: hypothetical protein NT176_02650 [Proteobacteria bacterium]|nr:hypothetical protein [Pseudomonadota bacterium]
MARCRAVAFVQFEPVGSHPVGHRRLAPARAGAVTTKHRGLRQAGPREHLLVEAGDLRLVARTNDRAEVVGQHARRALLHRTRDVLQPNRSDPRREVRHVGRNLLALGRHTCFAKSEAR